MNKASVSQSAHTVNHSPSDTRVVLPEGHRYFHDCLRENYARFIEWNLHKGEAWFFTMTFKTFISQGRGWIDLRKWLGHLHQSLFDLSGQDKGIRQLRWIVATEWQIRMVIHYHGLAMANGISTLSRKRWEYKWESLDRNTGFCRIYDADYKSAPYLAKYTSKNLGGELVWGGDWRGMKVPGSVSCGHAKGVSIG